MLIELLEKCKIRGFSVEILELRVNHEKLDDFAKVRIYRRS